METCKPFHLYKLAFYSRFLWKFYLILSLITPHTVSVFCFSGTSIILWLDLYPVSLPMILFSSFKTYILYSERDFQIYLRNGILTWGWLETISFVFLSFFHFFFFCFLGLHVEVPRLGSNWSYSCWPMPQPQQCRIQAISENYTTAHGSAGFLTHWARPGIKPATSWILVGFGSQNHNRNSLKTNF